MTVHHIFARKVLCNEDWHPDAANCPANFALLSRSTNAEFHDTPADEILSRLTPEERKLARVQLFGDEAGDRLKVERYEEFCEWRGQQLAEVLNEWLGLA